MLYLLMKFLMNITIIVPVFIIETSQFRFERMNTIEEEFLNTPVFKIFKPMYHICVWINDSNINVNETKLFKNMSQEKTMTIQDKIGFFPSDCNGFVFVKINENRICDLFRKKVCYLTTSQSLVIINTEVNEKALNECNSSFDSANVVLLPIKNKKLFVLSSPLISYQRYFTQSDISNVLSITQGFDMKIPDLKGRTVNVATFHYAPFTIIIEKNNKVQYAGIEMSIFQDLAKYLNFTWKLTELKGGVWSTVSPNGTVVGGVVQALHEGNADIGFSNLWLRNIYADVLDFSPSHNRIYMTFIVRRPVKLGARWQSFYTIFRSEVWLMIPLAFIIVTYIFWLVSGCQYPQSKPDLQKTALVMFGILVNSSSHLGRQGSVGHSSRLIAWWWFLFSILMTTAFTSSIVTQLTLPLYSPLMDTIRQLVENGYYWVDPLYKGRESTLADFYFNMQNYWQAKFEQQYCSIEDPKEIEERFKTDLKITFPVQQFGNEYVKLSINGLNSTLDLTGFRVLREYTSQTYTAFGLRKYSPLNEVFIKGIAWFIDFGLWDSLRRRLGQHPQNRKSLIQEQVQEFTEPQQFTMATLYPIFVLLCIGQTLALFVFLIELWYQKNLKRKKCLNSNNFIQPFPYVV